MDTSEMLARHLRRVVDEFIEGVLNELDLGDLERNIVGVTLRRETEMELVPGLVAVQAVFHAVDAATLSRGLPEWVDRVPSALPSESEFLSEMSWRLDPDGTELMNVNLELRPGETEVRRSFEAHLWEMTPAMNRSN